MKNMFDLTGKVALVTGASSGLGVQYAKLLADNGADLAILARRENKLEEVKKEIIAMGRKCEAYHCDVSKEEDVVNTFAKIEKDFSKIDILVNNAGVVYPGNDTKDWDMVMDINLRAVFVTVREAMKGMVERNYGKIINISSVAGLNGMAYMPSYNASKGGVIVLTKSQAMDGAEHGATVNCICPGVFESEMTQETFGGHVDDSACGGTAMKRIVREGELNGAMLYFASDASSYTTGQALVVDGGWTSYVP